MRVGRQNSQQIEEKSVSQPAQLSDKQKLNPWRTLAIVTCVLLLLSVFLNIYYFTTQGKEEKTASATVHSSPTPLVENQNTAPQKNALYLGLYEGKEVIFYTNDLADEGGSGADGVNIGGGSFTGAMAAVGNKPLGYSNPYDFRKLVNPQKIADNFPYPIGLIVDAEYGSNKENVFVSLMLNVQNGSTSPTLIKNAIYNINVKNQEKTEVWWTDLKHGTKEQYKDNNTTFGGAAKINKIIGDKFIELSLDLCFECSPYSEKTGILVVNIDTRKEKFLGMVGEVTINAINNTVTYKKLEAIQELCPTDIVYCNDAIGNGQRNVYKPSGTLITETLP